MVNIDMWSGSRSQRRQRLGSTYQQRLANQMALAREGSPSAIAQVLETCRRYLLLTANRGLTPELRAKVGGSDLVQETIVQAQQKFDEFRGETPLELLAWTGGILQNKIHNAYRHYVKTQKRCAGREVPLAGGDLAHADILPIAGDVPTPSTIAIASEEAQLIRAAMERLTADHRQVLLLRHWERLPFAEIADAMGRTPKATQKLWSRAVLALRKELEILSR